MEPRLHTSEPPVIATSSTGTGPGPQTATGDGTAPGLDLAEATSARIREALTTVIDPCCRDRGISVVDMGLVDAVEVDEDGHAQVQIMLTSGWCPFQVDLTAEISEAARSVDGVTGAEVRITLDHVWSPARMSEGARGKLRSLPDPHEVADRDAFVAAAPLPLVQIHRTPPRSHAMP